MKIHHFDLIAIGLVCMIPITCIIGIACTKQEAKTAETVVFTVADGICNEITSEVPNDWVTLACVAEDGISKILLRMPRAQWENVRRQTVRSLNQP